MLFGILFAISGFVSFLVYCCLIVGSRYDRQYDDAEQERYLAEYQKNPDSVH